MLYEMATGQQDFHGDSKMSTLAAILNQEPRPIGQLVAADGLSLTEPIRSSSLEQTVRLSIDE
jgi:hypothetical protein